MYKRKTYDVYEVQGLYDGDWSEECSEFTYKEARVTLKEYRDNLPNTAFRIEKKRFPIK